MNKFFKENWFKIGIFLSLLFVVSSLAYRFGIEQENQALISKTEIQEVEKISLPNSILGHWRNDEEKLDYIFYQNQNLLSVIRENDSSECTYDINKQDEEKNYLEIWFECPQPDWPGYAENHSIELSSDRGSFIDTMYIQGIAYRINGHFVFAGSMDSSSDNWDDSRDENNINDILNDKKHDLEEIESKIDTYNKMIEVKQSQQENLNTQFEIIDNQIEKTRLEIEKLKLQGAKSEIIREKQNYLETQQQKKRKLQDDSEKEENRYQDFLKEVEEQKQLLLDDIEN